MFAKETYMQRRALLKNNLGSGVLLFLGNDECGLNYEDNTFRYRQDSTFLYYFGLSCAGLSAIIDIDEDKEIIFGDELSIDAIVWMGSQPTLHEKCERVGVKNLMPSTDIVSYLHQCVRKGKAIHYLPPYRPEHKLKLMDWLGIPPAHQEGSVPFIRAVIAQRNYKSAEEIVEIEKACDVNYHMPVEGSYELVGDQKLVAGKNSQTLKLVIDKEMLNNIVTESKELPESAKIDLVIALITLKYTQSNSVCYAKGGQAIGIGAGQQSRIHCTRLAGQKADNWFLRQSPKVLNLPFKEKIGRADRDNAIDLYIGDEYMDLLADGEWERTFTEKPEVFTREEKRAWLDQLQDVALGSDAFFPFGDNIERAHKSGVKYVAQPGGSVRDDQVIETCNKYGMTMCFTGIRLFHH